MTDDDFCIRSIAANVADRILREQGPPWAIVNWAYSQAHTVVFPDGRFRYGFTIPFQERQRFEATVKLMLTA